ncbi:hypothetical protein C9374_004325 [Naegleria lovaniensis]|uniref:Ankyrin repeat protein n=1 Tax=Naegleria lovaniensis TaxID=51637 RepID=A0AA88GMB9_NAELO|nr:uncharacterized protein C9374_004325 [Naegleria lovaniensis]KAG2383654.1 hypothetical protein C9374_004325 [Naegleria lovaniensis]
MNNKQVEQNPEALEKSHTLRNYIRNQNIPAITECLSEILSKPMQHIQLIFMPELANDEHSEMVSAPFSDHVPLLWTACETQNLKIVELLLDAIRKSPCDVDTLLNFEHACPGTYHTKTLLYHICEIGCNSNIVEYILNEPKLDNFRGLSQGRYGIQESPFYACVKNGHLELVKLLFKFGSNYAHAECSELLVRDPVSDPCFFPLWVAAANNRFEIVKYLVEECRVNLDDVSGSIGYSSALGVAGKLKNAEIVRYLLERGANAGKDVYENTFKEANQNTISLRNNSEFTIVQRGFPHNLNKEEVVEAKQFVRDQWEIVDLFMRKKAEMRNNLYISVGFRCDDDCTADPFHKPQLRDIYVITKKR